MTLNEESSLMISQPRLYYIWNDKPCYIWSDTGKAVKFKAKYSKSFVLKDEILKEPLT